jgi:hypothetical protein
MNTNLSQISIQYSPYFIGIAGALFGLWQYRIRRKHDLEIKIWEKRCDIYSEYLGKLDQINADLMIDFSTFIGPTITSFLSRVLNDPMDKQPILDLQSSMSEMMIRIIRSMTKAKEEMNKLRLVCSDRLLVKLNEYGMVSEAQFGNLNELTSRLDLISGNAQSLISEFKQKQSCVNFAKLKSDIEIIMRGELKIKN